MRKSYLLLIFVVLLSGMLGGLRADYPKFPLMERFTNASCGPCASYNDAGYSAWVAANHNKLAIISYQVSWPGVDPMYSLNRALPGTRVAFYKSIDAENEGIAGVPTVAFNGMVGIESGGDIYTAPSNTLLTSALNAELAKRVPINVTPTFEIVGDTAKIHIDVASDEAMDNIRLQVLILESVVTYDVAPGTNGERAFPYVARYAVPSMNGTAFTIEAGGTKSFDLKQALNAALHKGRLYVVAFVEPSNTVRGNTHSIIQAGMSVAAIPMPPVIEPEVQYTQSAPYEQIKKDSIMTHVFTVNNTVAYDIQLKNIKVTNNLDENWEFVSTTIPDAIPTIKPGDSLVMEYKVKYIGDEPSSAVISVSFETWMSDEVFASLEGDNVRLPMPYAITFADISDNTKYAYATGFAKGDDDTYSAFSVATYFENKLVEIPIFSVAAWEWLLSNTKVIDSLEFLGMSTYNEFWMVDVMRGTITINKLKSLPDIKLFVGLDGETYYYQKAYYPWYDQEYGTTLYLYYNPANAFLTEHFGIDATVNANDLYLVNDKTQQYVSANVNGIADDPIGSVCPTFAVNTPSSSVYITDIAPFPVLSEYTTGIFTVAVTGGAVPVAAKYQNGTIRRVITGFNFAALPNQPSTSRPIETVANAIVDWMFNVNVIEDAEENLNPTNGLLLQTQPNPVISVSDVIVQNTNSMPVQAKVYLIDAAGNKVMDLFEGMLGVGNNSITLSNSNISAGTYFIISETATGKTYMSVAISK